MKHNYTCNNCRHFHHDPEEEGIFGECRKNAPVPMPQEVAGTQPGYSRTIYMGTWPAVFADDVCSQHGHPVGRHNRATTNAEADPLPEVLRGRDKAPEAASVIVGYDGEILKIKISELDQIVKDEVHSEEIHNLIITAINDAIATAREAMK